MRDDHQSDAMYMTIVAAHAQYFMHNTNSFYLCCNMIILKHKVQDQFPSMLPLVVDGDGEAAREEGGRGGIMMERSTTHYSYPWRIELPASIRLNI